VQSFIASTTTPPCAAPALSAPKPEGAHKRLNRLKQRNILDTPPDEAFGRITHISDGSGIPKAFQHWG